MFRMGMKNVVAAALILAGAVTFGAAQDQGPPDSQTATPDAKAILKKVAETYRNLQSYHFEGRYTFEQVTESIGLKDELKREELFVNAAARPGRSRIESKNTHISVTSVSDGKTKWIYTPGPNEYTKSKEGADSPVTGVPHISSPVMSHLASASNWMVGFYRVADRLGDAKIIGEETLEIGGRRSDCFVIEAFYFPMSTGNQSSAMRRKFWVDKSRHIVLRHIQQNESRMLWGRTVNSKTTHTFTVATTGEQIPESLFAFIPPEGAREVAELRSSPITPAPPRPAASPRPAPASVMLVGKNAISFALKDLNGNQVDLETLKGKVVLLDFWASWCGPCVAELPHIEKLHRDFKDKGLVTLGIDGEEADIARAYVKNKGYTFTTLLDENKEVMRKYGVTGIPAVFIIDREGKVRWQARGYGPGGEVRLRKAVEDVLKGKEPPSTALPRASSTAAPEEWIGNVVAPPSTDKGELIDEAGLKTLRLKPGALASHAIKREMPRYTREASQARATGAVEVEVIVSAAGKVIEARAVSGHQLLHKPAVEAAKKWEFESVEHSGAPVRMRGILIFTFNLQ